jgi:succinate dehydrogenase flavin-adding protein (antitoxin of CptAB toxin-antitoxin module)
MNNELKATLVKDLGIADLPQEAQDQILASLGDIILRSTTTAIFERLNDEQRVEFDRLSADEDPDKIQEFLNRTIPDMPKLMEEEVKKTIARFKQAEDTVIDNEQI